jgi:hypothetical protein
MLVLLVFLLLKINLDSFQNRKTFLESADEELSNEVLEVWEPG